MVIRLSRESLSISLDSSKFVGQKFSGGINPTLSICLLTSCDHLKKVSYLIDDMIKNSPLSNTLPCFLVIGLVEEEVGRFLLDIT